MAYWVQHVADDVQCENPAGLRALQQIMNRVGARLSVGDFVEHVCVAYCEAQRRVVTGHDMPARFRNSNSYFEFTRALNFVRGDSSQLLSVLVIGCGAGYAGLPSSYARKVVEENMASTVSRLDELQLTPELLSPNQGGLAPLSHSNSYDLVVTHSIAHFVLDLRAFFQFVARQVGPCGALVLAHEPNSQFWRNARVTSSRQCHKTRRQWKRILAKSLSPAAYWSKAKRLVGLESSTPLTDTVNMILRKRLGLCFALTTLEIAGVVDPHVPTGSEFRVGLQGLDARQIEQEYLPGFRLSWFEASEWPGLERHEVIKFRLPGRIFSAVFQRGIIG